MVLPKYRVVIFVNGCFWHGHRCHMFKIPASRTEFWLNKIGANQTRDLRNVKELIEAGWRVLTIWECSIKGSRRLGIDTLKEKITGWIKSDNALGNIESISKDVRLK